LLFESKSAISFPAKFFVNRFVQFFYYRAAAQLDIGWLLVPESVGYGRDCPTKSQPIPAEPDHAHSRTNAPNQHPPAETATSDARTTPPPKANQKQT